MPPIDPDAVMTIRVGTAVWALSLIGMLVFSSTLADHDKTWWLWTTVAGSALGVAGIALTTRRRQRIRGGAEVSN